MVLPIFQGSSKEAALWKHRHWKMGTSGRGKPSGEGTAKSVSLFISQGLCLVREGRVLSGDDALPAKASERGLNPALTAPGASLP